MTCATRILPQVQRMHRFAPLYAKTFLNPDKCKDTITEFGNNARCIGDLRRGDAVIGGIALEPQRGIDRIDSGQVIAPDRSVRAQ